MHTKMADGPGMISALFPSLCPQFPPLWSSCLFCLLEEFSVFEYTDKPYLPFVEMLSGWYYVHTKGGDRMYQVRGHWTSDIQAMASKEKEHLFYGCD